jgi:hypothetical protein
MVTKMESAPSRPVKDPPNLIRAYPLSRPAESHPLLYLPKNPKPTYASSIRRTTSSKITPWKVEREVKGLQNQERLP